MIGWLQQIPPERVLLWVFLAGGAWVRLREHTRSLRDQGRRIGEIGRRVAAIEGKLGVPTPLPPVDNDR